MNRSVLQVDCCKLILGLDAFDHAPARQHLEQELVTLVHLFECLGLVSVQDNHGVQGRGCLARSTISFGQESGRQLTGFGRETRTVPPSGGVLWTQVIALSTWGMPVYPLAAPPSRIVRTEEMDERLLAVKGAIHDFVSSSCTSGKKGTGAEHACEPRPAPRNLPAARVWDWAVC